jgi:outer membrane murein-binding lipoprotein Lpp
MSEPNKDGTDIMMALLMGLSGPRASKAWNESQQIKAESFLAMAEHWINQTAEENARLKAEVERLTKHDDDTCRHYIMRLLLESQNTFLNARVERLTKAGDAMASSIQFNEEMSQDYNGPTIVHQSVQRWNAAKEGKQP